MIQENKSHHGIFPEIYATVNSRIFQAVASLALA